MHKIYLTLSILLTASCSDNTRQPSMDIEGLPSIELRATGDISMPEPISQAAFVPNYVAGWASHILLLSDTGNIWRTTTEGDPPAIISEGDYIDILGLSREGEAGAFLSLSSDGKISAFIESDDEGNFQPIAVSYGGAGLKRFCAGPSDKAIWALGENGSAYPLSVSIKNSMVAEISAGEELKAKSAQTCQTDSSGNVLVQLENGRWTSQDVAITASIPAGSDITSFGDAGYIGRDISSGYLFYASEAPLLRISIVNGLSIRGLEKAAFAAVTPYPMGSVFNDGLIVIGDAKEPRIVIISASFAQQKLTPAGQ